MSTQVARRRIRRTTVAVALAGAATAVTAMPAAAGGWWTYPQLEHEILAIGEPTTVSADVLFRSLEAAEDAAASGEYFAYLVRDIDEAGLREAMSTAGPHEDWWTAPDQAIQLAPLALDRDDSNLGGATATFVVPEVEPGIYDVMLCDHGCARPLADVVPLRGIYVGDPDTVRYLREAASAGPELQQVLGQFEHVGSRLDGLHDQAGTLSDDVADLDQRLDGLTTSDHRLTAALAALETRVDDEPAASQPWWAYAGWFVAGAVLAIAWTRRRHGRSKDEPGDDRSHDDVDGVQSSPPELVTWEMDHGSPVR